MKREEFEKGTISFRKKIETLSESDFDGHTAFQHMTAEQRLEWVSNAAQFWFETRINIEDKPGNAIH
ncbi:MAG: hypothetical protein GF401_18570 [Chitinivibrionales bacterium]|nr:hypothetical protein [Chitinivibrionales bacterium]